MNVVKPKHQIIGLPPIPVYPSPPRENEKGNRNMTTVTAYNLTSNLNGLKMGATSPVFDRHNNEQNFILEIQKLMQDGLPWGMRRILDCGVEANWLEAH